MSSEQSSEQSAEQSALPIHQVIDTLRGELSQRDTLLLEAPPGAGKTTVVPLALLGEPWLTERKIIMLQPRRLAARNAAGRMASLLGEAVGDRVGYRVRLDSRIGPRTRIEVVTEGVLLRMLRDDPALEAVGLLIFDEFHERSLDADLGLALALHSRKLFDATTPPKILVMSATLGGEALEEYLQAPRLQCEGRRFPVQVIYQGARRPRERIVDRMAATVEQALQRHGDSSLLVFLPGRGEIRQLADRLAAPDTVTIHPLYGDLDLAAQQRAIAPPAAGERKVVLATNVAETSLTIEGVDVVIDAGLERQPRFDPNTGMSRLYTQAISRASAEQRLGRAGRLRPGFCYRLWSESQHDRLAPARDPEVSVADLAPLALQLFAWGIYDTAELSWLTPPPPGPFQQAVALLRDLGAVEGDENSPRLSAHGAAMADIAAHPRIAHLLLVGQAVGARNTASLLAAVLTERDPLRGESADLRERLDLLSGDGRPPVSLRGWVQRSRDLAKQLRSQLPEHSAVTFQRPQPGQLPGFLLACAYPDRIARRRHSGGFQLANGRSAKFAGPCALERDKWLVVADVGGLGKGSGDRIGTAVPLDAALFDTQLASLVREQTVVEWEPGSGRFLAERQRRIGALALSAQRLDEVPVSARTESLITLLRESRLQRLKWTRDSEDFIARASLMGSLLEDWPRFDQTYLLDTLEDWLGPYLAPVTRLSQLAEIKVLDALRARLSWDQLQHLEQMLPERIEVPSGARHRIDYRQQPPVLAVKLQEMFGCHATPSVAGGSVAVMVHLLSPAGRPLQVTQDLPSFWANGYPAVRKEMRGRYPKHPWPENPLTAAATGLTKGRLNQSPAS